MQMNEARQLKKYWHKEGNPPCAHKNREKVYTLRADTGDEVCTRCGEVFSRKLPRQRAKTI